MYYINVAYQDSELQIIDYIIKLNNGIEQKEQKRKIM